ncbi:MAG: right-handed parallel beta-helix repeat-containing protein [Planctomycetes bacterium]|nr:right-handed parallel beta-helix repeat-containing protein [Planctomycetota bacterium]
MRHLLTASIGFAFLAAAVLPANERPPVTQPRATSGDTAVEPDWSQKLAITVGPKDADLVGSTDKAIQAGVDYVARPGGGTVKLLPGTYKLRNSVFLQSKVRLLGAGDQTILFKEPSVTTKLAADSDWYDQEITLDNADGFQVGDGVTLRARGDGKSYDTVIKRTLIARTGNRFKLDRPLRENFWRRGNVVVQLVFPLVTGELVNDMTIENLALDGNRAKNENLDGNYGGCIFFQDCSRIHIRGVTARNNNGDGISWQICHDVVVENCTSENNAQLGLHPGSGSQRPVIRNNKLKNNDIGIFFCWGVKYGLAEKNTITGNRVGISIGHRDTDNLITLNEIHASKDVGILFRPERGKDFCGHRNRLIKNRLIDNGGEKAAAIDIQGGTESITIADNEFTESRGPAQRVAVRIGAQTRDIGMKNNLIKGFAKETEEGKR